MLRFCFILFCACAHGATYYVSTAGDNASAGSDAQPWRNVWYAARTVTAGDTVIIKAGEYNEFVTNTVSGTAGNPIVFTGERGAAGEWLTILDPSTPVTNGWVEATDIGAGVWAQTNLAFPVRELTINHQRVGFAYTDGDIASEISTAYYTNWANGLDLLALPSAVTVRTKFSGETLEFWDGIEALYCSTGSVCYLRLRDGSDPNGLNIRVAPNWSDAVSADVLRPAIQIAGKSYLVWSNLCIRGAIGCFFIGQATSHHITVESNYLANGSTRITIGTGAYQNTVRNNTITADYYGYTSPGAWGDATTTTKENLYLLSKYLMGDHSTFDNGIYISGAGNSNVISGNVISNNFGGNGIGLYKWTVPATDPTKDTIICSNIIRGSSSVGILISEGHTGTQIHDNLIMDNNINLRYHHVDSVGETNRIVYVYRNRSYLPDNLGQHIYAHFNDDTVSYHPSFWTYHNSFSGGELMFGVTGGLIVGNGGMTNTVFLNNIVSGTLYAGGGDASIEYWAGATMLGGFDYNLVTPPLPTYPSASDPAWFGAHNIKTDAAEWANAEGMSFSIGTGSGAIDAALDVTASFNVGDRSFDALPLTGAKAGSAWDIGAVEYGPRYTHTHGSGTLGASTR